MDCCGESPWGWLKLSINSPLDGAHTLTCALMLLNTDLHGHVSWGRGKWEARERETLRLWAISLTDLCFPPLEHWEAHDLWGLYRKPGGPQRWWRLPQGAAQGWGWGATQTVAVTRRAGQGTCSGATL